MRHTSSARPFSTSSAWVTRARIPSPRSRTLATTPPLRSVSQDSTSPSTPPACRTSRSAAHAETSSPASRAAPPSCRHIRCRPTFSSRTQYLLTKGHHQLKTGFRFIKVYASPFTNTTTRGGLTFNDNFTNSGTAAVGGAGLASILLGFPNAGSRNFLISPVLHHQHAIRRLRPGRLEGSSRLTLNLGIRYDVFTADTEKNNKLANFDSRSWSSSLPARTA